MFKVGAIKIETPVLLAPMEDVTNLAMRVIATRIAKPGIVFTEFVSAMAVHYNPGRSLPKMRRHPDEKVLAVQIFGADADKMAQSAAIAEELGADIVDINMGCWVPKVCRTGSGAALLKDPAAAADIVRAVAKTIRIPVTVKIRAGWDANNFAAPDLARRFQDLGASMITLHARFARQGFEGEANWSLIGSLRSALTIPLIGNGDVREPSDAVRMMRETGCDGVMVGRAAISNPWMLDRIRAAVMGEPEPRLPSIRERIETALEHVRLCIQAEAGACSWEEALANPEFPEIERRACRHLRGQIPLYIKGEYNSSEIRKQLTQCDSYQNYLDFLSPLLAPSSKVLIA